LGLTSSKQKRKERGLKERKRVASDCKANKSNGLIIGEKKKKKEKSHILLELSCHCQCAIKLLIMSMSPLKPTKR
jgi:hypothetical protein